MNKDQLITFLTGLAKVIGTALAVRGCTQAATIVTAGPVIEAVAGLVMTGISFYAGHHYNKTDAPTVTVQSDAGTSDRPPQTTLTTVTKASTPEPIHQNRETKT